VRYKPVVVVVVVVVVGKRTRARTRNIDIRDYSSPERAGGGVREEEAGRGVPGFEIAFCRCNRGADFKPTDSRGPRDGRIARNLNSARRLAVPFPARGGGRSQGASNAHPRWRAATFNARPPRVYVPRVPGPTFPPLPSPPPVTARRTDVSQPRAIPLASIPNLPAL